MEKGVSEAIDGIGASAVALGNIFADLAATGRAASQRRSRSTFVSAMTDAVKTARSSTRSLLGPADDSARVGPIRGRCDGGGAEAGRRRPAAAQRRGRRPQTGDRDRLQPAAVGRHHERVQGLGGLRAARRPTTLRTASNMAAEALEKHRSRGIQTVGLMETLTNAMKDAGLKVTDLDDKTKSAEAHQVAYNAILRLAATAHGDAARYARPTAGRAGPRLGAQIPVRAAGRQHHAERERRGPPADRSPRGRATSPMASNKNQEGFNLVSESLIIFAKGLVGAARSWPMTFSSPTTGCGQTFDAFADWRRGCGAGPVFQLLESVPEDASSIRIRCKPSLHQTRGEGSGGLLHVPRGRDQRAQGRPRARRRTAPSLGQLDSGGESQARYALDAAGSREGQVRSPSARRPTTRPPTSISSRTWSTKPVRGRASSTCSTKSLEQLAGEIDLANNNNTSLTDKLKLFGPAAEEAALKAKAYGVDIDAVALSVSDLAAAQQDVELDKIFDKEELADGQGGHQGRQRRDRGHREGLGGGRPRRHRRDQGGPGGDRRGGEEDGQPRQAPGDLRSSTRPSSISRRSCRSISRRRSRAASRSGSRPPRASRTSSARSSKRG